MSYGQDLDTLYMEWKDTNKSDSIRVKAFKDYTIKGFLYSNPDSAIILAKELVRFSKQKNYDEGRSIGINLQGLSYYNKGDYAKALGYFKQSLKISEDINDLRGVSTVLNNIGLIYLKQDDFQKALEYFKQNLKISEGLENKVGRRNALNNMGIIYRKQGKLTQAIESYQQSLEISKEIRDQKGIASALNNFAVIYKIQGDYSTALDYQYRNLKILENSGNQKGLSNCLTNIGGLYLVKKSYFRAMTNCQKSLDIAEEVGILDLQDEACECLYEAHKQLGNPGMALKYFEQFHQVKALLGNEDITKKLQQMEFQKQVTSDSLATLEEARLIDEKHKEEVRKKNRTRNILLVSGFFALLIAGGIYRRLLDLGKAKKMIEKEKDRSEKLLLNILPEEIAKELKENGEAVAKEIDQVSILFTDFKEFTQIAEKLNAQELVSEINFYFKAFDKICQKYNVEKIKTIGDAYMAAAGVPLPKADDLKNIIHAALEMSELVSKRKIDRDKEGKTSFEMRAGIHTGKVVAGVVGVNKFQYDIWGDTVNTASRMESQGNIGQVNISDSTYDIIKDEPDFIFESRGKIQAKGKGDIEMYFVRKR